MHQDGLLPEKPGGISSYFCRVTHPYQIELLGKITVEILRQGKNLSCTSVCLKLIVRLDATTDETELMHLRDLLGKLFGR
ncbi:MULTISPECIES: biofilm development regulator YmgB/AriR family protein [unclassified Erwinia]|uniref:biofilm development regulator YmgB/AriR family protein n=1 Tax=unclassified Erwinia TaxID=2622719 RepID=UPI00190E08D1|nr:MULTISPECIES: biofilm development regulator YmgB/AriR family protein [unclassified Erwinia]MBK0000755.1 hypothetical protein [Erwinia sp. S38]MCW1873042.1 biofilm development regulator YmgB/AriR family protein [Erwinia sp. INIA01]